jgi:hypothetical protein
MDYDCKLMDYNNCILIDNQIVPRPPGQLPIQDDLIYKMPSGELLITTPRALRARGVRVNFREFRHIHYGSRLENAFAVQRIMDNRITFEDLIMQGNMVH